MPGTPYKDVIKVLLDRFPEFMETEEYEEDASDLPYCVWGGFGRFATDYMRRLPTDRLDDDPFVARVFDLANELMDSDDPDTQTIVVIELFENFYSYGKTLEIARRKLNTNHLTWLEKQSGMVHTLTLHYEGDLIVPQGLDAISELLAGCSWPIKVRRSELERPPFMEAYDHRIELKMVPGQGPRFSFYGAPFTHNREEARRLLDELSERLVRGDIAHRIALYRTGREDVLLEYFHHGWPRDQAHGDTSHS